MCHAATVADRGHNLRELRATLGMDAHVQDMVDAWHRVLGGPSTEAVGTRSSSCSRLTSASGPGLGSSASASASTDATTSAGTDARASASADASASASADARPSASADARTKSSPSSPADWALPPCGAAATKGMPMVYRARGAHGAGRKEREGGMTPPAGGWQTPGKGIGGDPFPSAGLHPQSATGSYPYGTRETSSRVTAGCLTGNTVTAKAAATGWAAVSPCSVLASGCTTGALQSQVAASSLGAAPPGEGGGVSGEGAVKAEERDSDAVEIFFFPNLERTGGSRRRHRRYSTSALADVQEYRRSSIHNAALQGGLCTPYSSDVSALLSRPGGKAGSTDRPRESALQWGNRAPLSRGPQQMVFHASTGATFSHCKEDGYTCQSMPRLQSLGLMEGQGPATPQGAYKPQFGPIAKAHACVSATTSTGTSPIRSNLKTKRQRSFDYHAGPSSLDKSKSPRNPVVRKVRFNNVVTVYGIVKSASEA